MKKVFLILFILSVIFSPLSAKNRDKDNTWFGEPHYPMFELGAGFFYHTYYFETKDGDLGDEAHLKYVDDFGYNDKYLNFTGDFIFRFKSIKLSLNYTMFKEESEYALKKSVTFNDAFFDSGENIKSKFNVHLLTLDFCWYILNLDLGKNFNFKLGPSIRIDAFITGIRLDGTDSDKGDKFDTPIVPFPSIGLSFETTIFKYSGLFFDINGMYAGKYLGYMNWKTGLRVYPWHWTAIELAYRHIYAKALWKGDLVKTDFHGLNMAFLIRF